MAMTMIRVTKREIGKYRKMYNCSNATYTSLSEPKWNGVCEIKIEWGFVLDKCGMVSLLLQGSIRDLESAHETIACGEKLTASIL